MRVPVPIGALGGAVCLTSFAALARAVSSSATVSGDSAIRAEVLRSAGPGTRAAAEAAGPIGKEWLHVPVAVMLSAFLWRRGAGRRAWVPFGVSAVSELTNRTLERTLARRRPPPGQPNPHKPSFPSGHAMEATAVALTSAYALVREELVPARAAFPTAAGVSLASGVSRLYADRHWASDALGGWLLGVAIAGVGIALYEAL